jgi:hypothetical protein
VKSGEKLAAAAKKLGVEAWPALKTEAKLK